MTGIYIKGMQMPKENAICVMIYPDGIVTSQYGTFHLRDGSVISQYDTVYLGTAVPVPDHGDLIDLSTVNLADGPYEYDEWADWALRQYLDAPIVIPADRKEGE